MRNLKGKKGKENETYYSCWVGLHRTTYSGDVCKHSVKVTSIDVNEDVCKKCPSPIAPREFYQVKLFMN